MKASKVLILALAACFSSLGANASINGGEAEWQNAHLRYYFTSDSCIFEDGLWAAVVAHAIAHTDSPRAFRHQSQDAQGGDHEITGSEPYGEVQGSVRLASGRQEVYLSYFGEDSVRYGASNGLGLLWGTPYNSSQLRPAEEFVCAQLQHWKTSWGLSDPEQPS